MWMSGGVDFSALVRGMLVIAVAGRSVPWGSGGSENY